MSRSARGERRNGWRTYTTSGLILAALLFTGAVAARAASGGIDDVVQATTTEPEPPPATSTTPSEPAPPPAPKPDPAPPPPPPSPAPSPAPQPTAAVTGPTGATTILRSDTADRPRPKKKAGGRDRRAEETASPDSSRTHAVWARPTTVREDINAAGTRYAYAPVSSPSAIVLSLLVGLVVVLGIVPLALGLMPARLLAAFSDQLALHRSELAFLGATTLACVAIGFATVHLGN